MRQMVQDFDHDKQEAVDRWDMLVPCFYLLAFLLDSPVFYPGSPSPEMEWTVPVEIRLTEVSPSFPDYNVEHQGRVMW